MRAQAPGKIVISGAYAVLDGAPAIVAAVDRYVVADSARPAELVTPEVRAAVGEGSAPSFDASALRESGRKLGLGSSAAIVVASLAALELEMEPGLTDDALCTRILAPALAAHAAAQGGGSGIDVAASSYGGILVARRQSSGLAVERVALPAGFTVSVLALGRSASTPELIARVRALKTRDSAQHAELLGGQRLASEQAASAVAAGSGEQLISALRAQFRALRALGDAAGAPIVTDEVVWLSERAEQSGAAALPAGAGGGDVALWIAPADASPPPPHAALTRLALHVGARGVHSLP